MPPWLRYLLGATALAGAGAATFFALRAAGVVGELPRGEGDSTLMNALTLGSTKQEFVAAMLQASEANGVLPSTAQLLAAWAAYESGWGKTKQAREGFNVFNVSKGSWTGPTISGSDVEFSAGSTRSTAIQQQWRAYESLQEAVADLLALLKNSRYANFREAYTPLMNGDPAFVASLGIYQRGPDGVVFRSDTRANSAPYYTMPISQYQSSYLNVLSIVHGFTALA